MTTSSSPPRPDDTLVSPPPDSSPTPARRPSGRSLILLAVLVAAGAGVALYATGVIGGGGGKGGGGVADNTYPTAVTHILRGSLSSQQQVSATLTYAGSATIVVPSGTSPSNLSQAQQQVTTAEGQLRTANASLATDTTTLSQLEANLAAAKAKETVDCAGAGAAQSAASPSGGNNGSPSNGGGGGGGGGGSGACGTDAGTVSGDDQSLAQDQAKVATDRSQVSSAETSLAAAETSLNAAAASASIIGQSSTYTTLPAVGAIVKRGHSLYSISGSPVFLLYGSTAAWRTFAQGMSPGPDVAELNRNLDALGYGRGLAGDAFTPATAAAIDKLESAHGATPTGKLLLGSVVFQPGAVRVTSVTPTLGETVQPGPVLTTTLTTRQVQIQLDAGLEGDVKVGDPVVITLPDNSTTPGRVTYVGTVATTPSSGGNGNGGNGGGGGGGGGGGNGGSAPTINVYVTPTDPAATGTLDQAPVNVSITTASVNSALYVPVNALLALSSGGYAVEEIGAGGAHQLVGVSLGLFDDQSGTVQISGAGVAAGQRVVIPNV